MTNTFFYWKSLISSKKCTGNDKRIVQSADGEKYNFVRSRMIARTWQKIKLSIHIVSLPNTKHQKRQQLRHACEGDPTNKHQPKPTAERHGNGRDGTDPYRAS